MVIYFLAQVLLKKVGFNIFYKTGNNEPLGRGDIPKKLDNTSETISNLGNVVEDGPELPCSWDMYFILIGPCASALTLCVWLETYTGLFILELSLRF